MGHYQRTASGHYETLTCDQADRYLIPAPNEKNHACYRSLAGDRVCLRFAIICRHPDKFSQFHHSPEADLLKTCPVSGDNLGEMGQPFVFVYKGQQVKLCCPDCKKDFDKNPDKYMKIIRAADKPQKK